MRYQFKHT